MQCVHARESSNTPADSQTGENCTRVNDAQCVALNIIQTLDVAGWRAHPHKRSILHQGPHECLVDSRSASWR